MNWNQELIKQMTRDLNGPWSIMERFVEDVYQRIYEGIALLIKDLTPKIKGMVTVLSCTSSYVILDLELSEMLHRSINDQLELLAWEIKGSREIFTSKLG
jgi:hypothetical protein